MSLAATAAEGDQPPHRKDPLVADHVAFAVGRIATRVAADPHQRSNILIPRILELVIGKQIDPFAGRAPINPDNHHAVADTSGSWL
jgi:hypothetical protein